MKEDITKGKEMGFNRRRRESIEALTSAEQSHWRVPKPGTWKERKETGAVGKYGMWRHGESVCQDQREPYSVKDGTGTCFCGGNTILLLF